MTCGSCHNPHGNGQFRILNKFPEATGTGFSDEWVVNILSTVASNDRVYTEVSHALQVGDAITIAGHTGSTPSLNGNWFVKTVSANYFTISATWDGTTFGATADITVGGTGGTVTRTSGVTVTDATLPAENDARNYTVMQVKGTEGTEATYLLYASQVQAAVAAGTFNGIPGTYGPTGGDYFARAVPWNPGINTSACDPTVSAGSDNPTNQAACATAVSAPNGRPSTFSGQITAWCSTCHTRYFANNNPNPETTDPLDTTASWQNPRPGDSLFKYQHRTVSGRDCLTCHVSHGSNATMDGAYSSTYTYPDGTESPSSRLLKIDNRGTCQACHDPTETTVGGDYVGPTPVPAVP